MITESDATEPWQGAVVLQADVVVYKGDGLRGVVVLASTIQTPWCHCRYTVLQQINK